MLMTEKKQNLVDETATTATDSQPAVATAPTNPEPTQPGTEGKEAAIKVKDTAIKGQMPTQSQFDGVPAAQPGTETIDI